MPPSEAALLAIVDAAKFSSAQLARIASTALGVELSSISNAPTPHEQAADIVNYAAQYGLIKELASIMLQLAADVPAAQNHIFGDNVAETSNIDVLRIEAKLDRILERMQEFDRRLRDVESQAQAQAQAQAQNLRQANQVSITPKTLVTIMVMFAIIVAGQISVLAWLGH
jgi:uncharacterized protein YdcH (DUF465 family)